MAEQAFITHTDSEDKKELVHLCMGIMRSCYYDEPLPDKMREWLNLERKYYFFETENAELERKCRMFLNLYLENFNAIKDYPCFKPFKNYLPNKEARHAYLEDPKQSEIFDLEKLIDATTTMNGDTLYFKPVAEINLVSGEQVTDALTSQINTINENIEKNPNFTRFH